jgi:cellulose synthase/poly-beta-1,6-N-acetylglucosamine synthase-like glycosyltransferase
MNFSLWMRQSHRWLSIVFTATVIANFVFRAVASDESPPWLTYSPLPPLFFQLFTGLYLFTLPYSAQRHSQARA